MNTDNRTLASLLKLEETYTVTGTYLSANIKPEMRSKLATWMLEVCEEQECTDEVYATAMNIFDRLMCVLHQVEVYHLQLLGSVCLFIASKLASSHKLTAPKLVDYTDNSISLEDLLEWELFVMEKLRWDVCSIVPNEFVEILLNELELDQDTEVLKKHCFAFTAMCSTDLKFSKYPASMIACACIMNALEGLEKLNNSQTEYSRLAIAFNAIADIDIEVLNLIKEQVADLFRQSAETVETDDSAYEASMDETPTEMHFENDYHYDIDYNMQQQHIQHASGLAKTMILSPAPSSPASSSGVSSTSSLLSPSLLSSAYYTSQDMVSMMMITPPLANSLPMPEFGRFESQCTKRDVRRSQRQSQKLIRC